jgi:hypothetical protein
MMIEFSVVRATGEDCEPAEEALLVGFAELDAPIERRADCPLGSALRRRSLRLGVNRTLDIDVEADVEHADAVRERAAGDQIDARLGHGTHRRLIDAAR